jgi:pyruvate,water dikinase
METNQRLWDLAEIAKSVPVVRAAFCARVPDIMLRLQETPEGRAFLVELNRFLTEYGHRELKMDILYPTWGEDPTPVLAFVRRYLDLDPNSSPRRQQEHLFKQREELTQTVEARIKRDPVGRLVFWPVFHRILTDTQAHTRERDTMHFELTRIFPPFRRMLLELGRRWTGRGLINEPADMFFLTLAEMGDVIQSPRSMKDQVAKRRVQFEKSKLRVAPAIIRDGQQVVPENLLPITTVHGEYQGIAGSPGVVTGIARVVQGVEDFDKLAKGELLIAPLTNPVWTPLFAIAGGVITEVGGILSHGAIIAREYGIPAVMAVVDATKTFKDGQRLTIDGNKGIVFVEQGAVA